TAVLQANHGILSERHEVGEQKAVSGFDFVFTVNGRLRGPRSHGMTCKGQCHIESTPIISTAAPLFRPRALRLWRQAVIEEETRIALECFEICIVRKDERCTGQLSGPLGTALCLARIEQQEIL